MRKVFDSIEKAENFLADNGFNWDGVGFYDNRDRQANLTDCGHKIICEIW